jgi:hypothetical protein
VLATKKRGQRQFKVLVTVKIERKASVSNNENIEKQSKRKSKRKDRQLSAIISHYSMLIKITYALSSIYGLPCNAIVYYNLKYSVTALKTCTCPRHWDCAFTIDLEGLLLYSTILPYTLYVGFTVFLCHKM